MRLYNNMITAVPLSSQNYQKKDKVSFKADGSIDIGASDPRASEKMQFNLSNGEVVHKVARTYVNDTRDGFESNYDFGEKLNKSIIKVYKETVGKITDVKEKTLNKLVIFLPGPIYRDDNGGLKGRTANLKDRNGKGLNDIDLDLIKAQLIQKGKEEGLPISDNLEFKPVKDAVGSAIGAAMALVKEGYSNKLKEGNFVTVIMPGGGCTIADLMPLDNHIYVKTTESAYNVSAQRIDKHITRLGDVGATAKTVIRNYANGLGITDEKEIKILQALGKSEIATIDSLEIKISANGNSSKEEKMAAEAAKEAVKILAGTGYFNIENKEIGKDKFAVLTVKTDSNSVQAIRNARFRTFDLYSQAIAEAIILKNNEEINTVVLTGPLTHGIDAAIRRDKEFYNDEVQRKQSFFCKNNNDKKLTQTYFNLIISNDPETVKPYNPDKPEELHYDPSKQDPYSDDPTLVKYKKPEIKDLRSMILAKVDRYIGEHTTPNMIALNNKFEVICDEKIKVADNTVAGEVLLDKRSQQVSLNRSNWWKIPREALGLEDNDKPKSI